MSADRLRAAADMLDRYNPDATQLTIDGFWATKRELAFYRGVARQARATAALLRAVAGDATGWPDGHVSDNGPRHGYGECCQECGEPWPCWPSTVHTTAEALASAVLGDTDD